MIDGSVVVLWCSGDVLVVIMCCFCNYSGGVDGGFGNFFFVRVVVVLMVTDMFADHKS